MNTDPQSFPVSFCSLTGYSPMRWQKRLFRQLVNGEIPAALDLPTGLGKTSVMAIWLVARALAGEDALKAVPRRLVYIVDRRAVVDQATEEAEKLRQALNNDAAYLKGPLGLSNGALPISTLRGAHVDNREWLDNPAALAIIVGTVDMIGSRLLFEGYGVSRKMRPYHAGLLGADTLIVLDEAHLVPPFEALLWRIANGAERFGSRAESGARLVPPFKLLPLSATGRAQPASDSGQARSAFRLEDEDLSDPIVRGRLSAKKTVRFIETGDDKNALAEELARQAWKLSEDGGKPTRSLIYCDSREAAEKVKAGLDKRGAGHKADTELFVGARRVKEREGAKAWLEKHGFLAGSPCPANPAFLIATSAGEVGIDLDAGHMVCDLVPWERMVQRLGRVNRRGQGDATIIVVHGGEPKPKKPDAPTDQELRQGIAYRSLSVLKELPNVETGRDASPGALRDLKLRAEKDEALRKKIGEATTPEPLRPALTRALVDAWSMTSLEQHTGRPDVAPWLRGWVEPDNQSIVIWRTFLPVREGSANWPRTSAEKKEVEAFFEAAPAHESEKLETETYRVADWLQDRAKALLPLQQDVQGEQTEDAVLPAGTDDADAREVATLPTTPRATPLHSRDVVLFVLLPDGSYAARYTLGRLAAERKGKEKEDFISEFAGKILIVDARIGGLNEGVLHSKKGDGFPTADTDKGWSEDAGFRVRRVASEGYESKVDEWHFEDDFVLRANGDGDAEEWLVVEHFRSAAKSEDARSVSRPQELGQHQSWAEQKAGDIASKIGLSDPAAEALAVAAFLHDEGKRALRWQRAFRAPHEKDVAGAYKIFAKTRGPINQQILDGYRHEFGSLPYAEAHPRFKALPEDWRDLVLHLIAAHHGRARPLIATRGCEDAPPSALDERAREVALRFARLQKRWGPWGLAWWEALLRAADQQASRDNDKGEDLGASHGDGK
ncbi:MAG: type I-G CRISPR-associated helicase/endonuclease Cas3g [Beijerinckiaceae bacterium]